MAEIKSLTLVELGPDDLAKYPFLEETGDYVRGLDLDVDELTKPEYTGVLERARSRALEAMKDGRISTDFSKRETEILSFPLTLVLMRATGLDHAMSRYAMAEARRVEEFLRREKSAIVTTIFERLLKIRPVRTTEFAKLNLEYEIPVLEYLKRAVHFHTPSWRLANRVIENGSVLVSVTEIVRLLREEIYGRVHTSLKSAPAIKLKGNLKEVVNEIISAAPPLPMRRVFTGEYPPCVSEALELLQTGQNVPHYGRFLMTTFLLHAGKSVDEIIGLYPKVPDFNERITRYQVEHIAGLRGGRTRYEVPGCRTVLANNFCFRTEACGKIVNPLQFGRDRKGDTSGGEGGKRRTGDVGGDSSGD